MFIENFNLVFNHTLHFHASESPGGVVTLQMAGSQSQSFQVQGRANNFARLDSRMTRLLLTLGAHFKHTVLKSGRTL